MNFFFVQLFFFVQPGRGEHEIRALRVLFYLFIFLFYMQFEFDFFFVQSGRGEHELRALRVLFYLFIFLLYMQFDFFFCPAWQRRARTTRAMSSRAASVKNVFSCYRMCSLAIECVLLLKDDVL